jgi:hypothetical protein
MGWKRMVLTPVVSLLMVMALGEWLFSVSAPAVAVFGRGGRDGMFPYDFRMLSDPALVTELSTWLLLGVGLLGLLGLWKNKVNPRN